MERSDNESMRMKKETMEQFIRTRFYDLPEDADVMEAFVQFEKECLQAELETFALENQIEVSLMTDLFSSYAFGGSISEDAIRKKLAVYKLGLLKMTRLTKIIKQFIEYTYKKYKAEGES